MNVRLLLDILEYMIVLYGIGVMVLGLVLIVYFYYLRFTGIIPSGYRITAAIFDDAIDSTSFLPTLRKLRLGRKMYFIFLYTFFIALPLIILLVVWLDPVK